MANAHRSVVTAHDILSLISGNNSTIKGIQAEGNAVLASIGCTVCRRIVRTSGFCDPADNEATACAVRTWRV
jgi:hypothetical protein